MHFLHLLLSILFTFILQLSISSEIPNSDSEYSLELELAHEIVPSMCTHVVTPSKIEVKLRKKEGLRWNLLEGEGKEEKIKAIPQGEYQLYLFYLFID